MKKTIFVLMLIASLTSFISISYAMPVFDAPNYALNTIRNVLLETQHVAEMLEAAKRLMELKTMAQEFQFFSSELIEKGFSEIFGFFNPQPPESIPGFTKEFTDGYMKVLNENPYYNAKPEAKGQVQNWVSRSEQGATLPYYLNLVPDPMSENHQYITFEQAQIARTFDEAKELRDYAGELSKQGEELSEAASRANLLGAARLEAGSMGKLYEILGTLLRSQGRLAELQSLSLEQVSRREKKQELERQRVIQDFGDFVKGPAPPAGELL